MVSLRPLARAAALLCAFPLLASGCNVDFSGLFGSNDFAERFREKDTFHYLRDSERNPAFYAPYSFIVLSDTHIEGGNTRGLEQIAGAAEAEEARFVVITGDITQDGRRQDLEQFLAIAESLRSLDPPVPLYPVIGNHDIYFGNWPVWRDLIGSTVYRVDSPDTSLIVLDSANANFGQDQLKWLEDQLASVKKNAFIFTHANLFTEAVNDIEMVTDTRERARVLSLLPGRGDAMFAGHVHRRIIREAGGVWYLTLEDFRDNASYCLVRVDALGYVSWEFKKL
jgi:3',5'-cyclic AMP phosphodiesterase CpdA